MERPNREQDWEKEGTIGKSQSMGNALKPRRMERASSKKGEGSRISKGDSFLAQHVTRYEETRKIKTETKYTARLLPKETKCEVQS